MKHVEEVIGLVIGSIVAFALISSLPSFGEKLFLYVLVGAFDIGYVVKRIL